MVSWHSLPLNKEKGVEIKKRSENYRNNGNPQLMMAKFSLITKDYIGVAGTLKKDARYQEHWTKKEDATILIVKFTFVGHYTYVAR